MNNSIFADNRLLSPSIELKPRLNIKSFPYIYSFHVPDASQDSNTYSRIPLSYHSRNHSLSLIPIRHIRATPCYAPLIASFMSSHTSHLLHRAQTQQHLHMNQFIAIIQIVIPRSTLFSNSATWTHILLVLLRLHRQPHVTPGTEKNCLLQPLFISASSPTTHITVHRTSHNVLLPTSPLQLIPITSTSNLGHQYAQLLLCLPPVLHHQQNQSIHLLSLPINTSPRLGSSAFPSLPLHTRACPSAPWRPSFHVFIPTSL